MSARLVMSSMSMMPNVNAQLPVRHCDSYGLFYIKFISVYGSCLAFFHKRTHGDLLSYGTEVA